MDELAARRAHRASDSRLWSPRDALEDAIRHIDDGKDKPIKLVIHAVEEGDEGRWIHYYSCAGMTFAEHIAILSLAQTRLMEDWRGKGD